MSSLWICSFFFEGQAVLTLHDTILTEPLPLSDMFTVTEVTCVSTKLQKEELIPLYLCSQ